jgi:methylated-DNA-[protein]-cysteine S-methyltransferase
MSLAIDAILRLCTAQLSIDTPLGAWFDGQKHHPGTIEVPERPDDAVLARAARQLAAYFGGRSGGFDIPLDLHGTAFQRRVWEALLRIPAGGTASYAELARSIDAPQAVRAVGAAVGRNPLSVIVPCHRVLGSDGSLTGYAGGIERKRALLDLEARSIDRRAAA